MDLEVVARELAAHFKTVIPVEGFTVPTVSLRVHQKTALSRTHVAAPSSSFGLLLHGFFGLPLLHGLNRTLEGLLLSVPTYSVHAALELSNKVVWVRSARLSRPAWILIGPNGVRRRSLDSIRLWNSFTLASSAYKVGIVFHFLLFGSCWHF